MKDNSPVKSSQSRNFSSKITLENSIPSPKSSPKREITLQNRDRLISDPKFSNELIFEKQVKNINL